MRWAPDREFYVENALNVVVDDGAAALAAFQSGLKHKIMASHKMNATSSRAHCVFVAHSDAQLNHSCLHSPVMGARHYLGRPTMPWSWA